MEDIGARLKAWPSTLRAADAFCILYLLLLTALACAAPSRIPHWWLLVPANIVALAAMVVARRLALACRNSTIRFVLDGVPLILFIWLWSEIGMLQHVLHQRWFDQTVIDFERWVLGVDLSLWVQRFISRPVTEWMMFGYFAYLPAIPLLAVILHFKVRAKAMDTFVFAMALAYGTCFLGFILFPVEGPRYWFEGRFTHDLSGYVFRWLTRLMEDYGHYPGGCFPSPHSTAGTVMLVLAYRRHRPSFWVLVPVIGTFYLATVYGRYHYVSDTIAGIALGLAVGWAAPRIEAWWDALPGPSPCPPGLNR